jgi:hypothetical protein
MDTTFGFQTICDKGFSDAEEVIRAPRGAMRKEMTDINIPSVPAGMPALG